MSNLYVLWQRLKTEAERLEPLQTTEAKPSSEKIRSLDYE